MAEKKRPAIPVPRADLLSLTETAHATKEAIEQITGVSGDPADQAVTWNDLLRRGIIDTQQLPRQS